MDHSSLKLQRPATRLGRDVAHRQVCPSFFMPVRDCQLQPRPSRSGATYRPSALHSTYPLMERRSAAGSSVGMNRVSKTPSGAVSSRTWLPACVRHIVSSMGGQAGREPMLQLVFSSGSQHRFDTVAVSRSLADDPKNWSELASHVRSSGANGLVLVRPVASPEQHCVYAAAQGLPVSPASADQDCSAPCRDAPACAAGEVLDGKVGACCDGDVSASSSNAAPEVDRPSSSSSTRYYGLVVQGSSPCEADGCWVLKTTRSDGGGTSGVCSCVHFCLTRVCHGQPLYEQLRDAWLVTQAA